MLLERLFSCNATSADDREPGTSHLPFNGRPTADDNLSSTYAALYGMELSELPRRTIPNRGRTRGNRRCRLQRKSRPEGAKIGDLLESQQRRIERFRTLGAPYRHRQVEELLLDVLRPMRVARLALHDLAAPANRVAPLEMDHHVALLLGGIGLGVGRLFADIDLRDERLHHGVLHRL